MLPLLLLPPLLPPPPLLPLLLLPLLLLPLLLLLQFVWLLQWCCITLRTPSRHVVRRIPSNDSPAAMAMA
jgi:hypothetical protein